MLLTQSLFNGLLIGCYYALMASGFALVLGVVRIFNMAHGEFLVLGAYVAYWLWAIVRLDPLVAIVPAIGVLAVVGLLAQRLLARIGEPRGLNGLVITFGLSILAQNLFIQLWTADYRIVVVNYLSDSIQFGPITLPIGRMIVAGISLLIILCLQIFISHTYTGKAMRAIAQDRNAAALMGINVASIDAMTYSLGAALAGIAGVLFVALNYVHPAAGHGPMIIAIILSILGGVGQIGAVLVGGVLLGMLEALAVVFLGAQWREPVFFLVLLLALAMRPRGLFRGLGT